MTDSPIFDFVNAADDAYSDLREAQIDAMLSGTFEDRQNVWAAFYRLERLFNSDSSGLLHQAKIVPFRKELRR